jgi:hypothetical protein
MALSETFYITLLTTASATLLVIVRWMYRSKCSHIKFCGVEIERNVVEEEKIDIERQDSTKINL